MAARPRRKPLGRFESTYMGDMTAPQHEYFVCATRHGARPVKSRQSLSEFPTGISTYKVAYDHAAPHEQWKHSQNKQLSTAEQVAPAPFAGYQTTYGDQSLLLRKSPLRSVQNRLESPGKHAQSKPALQLDRAEREIRSYGTVQMESSAERTHGVKTVYGPWNYTGKLEEDIRIQKDRVLRAKQGQYYLPGYLGHKPLHNPPSTIAFQPRSPEKEKMLLFDLDQYSRELWPHYKGHKSQAIVNLRENQDRQPPTKDTTYGWNNFIMTRERGLMKERHAEHMPSHNKSSGMKSLFSRGSSEITSANGTMMAEKFYSFARPLEGSLATSRANKALASKYM